ncbi:MAG: septal ring lytic transglycosylase RlpA family protein [Alcaligenaceae bacterium]
MHDTVIRRGRLVCVCLVVTLLAACSGGARRGGGYYLDDGPDAVPPANLDAVPDAVPRIEPFTPSTSQPYVIFGKTYTPDVSGGPYKVQGRASWYGKKFHGNSTANGERYNMYGMTAAHPTLPLPSYARVTRVSSGKSVVVRVNDRGPFLNDRIIDLSYVAAYKLGMIVPGSAEVVVERITPDQIQNWPSAPATLNVATATSAPLRTVASTQVLVDSNATAVQTQPTTDSQTPRLTAGSMYLQLGAFSDATKAKVFAARVSYQIPADLIALVRVEQTANNLHRVRIGPFASREAAVQAVIPVQSSTGVAPSLSPP